MGLDPMNSLRTGGWELFVSCCGGGSGSPWCSCGGLSDGRRAMEDNGGSCGRSAGSEYVDAPLGPADIGLPSMFVDITDDVEEVSWRCREGGGVL